MARESEPAIYRITLEGHLDASWSKWFDDLDITHDADGNTVLTGPVCDQSALHGILARIRDMNLTLLAVAQIKQSK